MNYGKGFKVTAALLATAFCGAASSAYAEGWYVGGSVGQAAIEAKENVDFGAGLQSLKLDEDDTGFKVFGGYQFLPWLGIEVGYLDLGAPEGSLAFTVPGVDIPDVGIVDVNFAGDVSAELTGFTAELVATVPIGPVSLFAKAGGLMWDGDLKVSGVGTAEGVPPESVSLSEGVDGEDLTYGVGASIAFGRLSVRAEYQIFDISDVDDVNMYSIGLVFTPGAN